MVKLVAIVLLLLGAGRGVPAVVGGEHSTKVAGPQVHALAVVAVHEVAHTRTGDRLGDGGSTHLDVSRHGEHAAVLVVTRCVAELHALTELVACLSKCPDDERHFIRRQIDLEQSQAVHELIEVQRRVSRHLRKRLTELGAHCHGLLGIATIILLYQNVHGLAVKLGIERISRVAGSAGAIELAVDQQCPMTLVQTNRIAVLIICLQAHFECFTAYNRNVTFRHGALGAFLFETKIYVIEDDALDLVLEQEGQFTIRHLPLAAEVLKADHEVVGIRLVLKEGADIRVVLGVSTDEGAVHSSKELVGAVDFFTTRSDIATGIDRIA